MISQVSMFINYRATRIQTLEFHCKVDPAHRESQIFAIVQVVLSQFWRIICDRWREMGVRSHNGPNLQIVFSGDAWRDYSILSNQLACSGYL